MALKLAGRLDKIEPSPTLEITALAKKMKADGLDVVGFGGGEPDFDTPDFIKQAAIDALNRGDTKYTPVGGTAQLKEAVTEKLKRDHGLQYSPSQVVVGVGGKHVIYNFFMSILNPGDEVIIPGPYWVSYKDIVALAEGEPIIVDSGIEAGFKLTPAQLEGAITPKTRVVIINSPSNPTGVAYTKQELEAFAEVLRKNPHVWVMTDDMYEKIVYDDVEFHNIPMVAPDLVERTFVVNGLSKAYSMTGWRLGYGASTNSQLIQAITMIQGQSTSNPTSFSQAGGAAALISDQTCIAPMLEQFAKRRDYIVEQLSAIEGIEVVKPQGAFYLFPDFSKIAQTAAFQRLMERQGITSPSKALSAALLEEKLVAVVPGIAFGYDMGFRISYASSMENLEKGAARMGEFFASLV